MWWGRIWILVNAVVRYWEVHLGFGGCGQCVCVPVWHSLPSTVITDANRLRPDRYCGIWLCNPNLWGSQSQKSSSLEWPQNYFSCTRQWMYCLLGIIETNELFFFLQHCTWCHMVTIHIEWTILSFIFSSFARSRHFSVLESSLSSHTPIENLIKGQSVLRIVKCFPNIIFKLISNQKFSYYFTLFKLMVKLGTRPPPPLFRDAGNEVGIHLGWDTSLSQGTLYTLIQTLIQT